MNATRSAKPRPLRRDIIALCPTRGEQPLRHRGVEAAGHRVLDQRAMLVAEKGADLEMRLLPFKFRIEHQVNMGRRLRRDHISRDGE